MSEFGLIELIRRRAGAPGSGVTLGIGDDAAVLQVPQGFELVATTDTLNAGVHFFGDVSPADLGHKSLAVNLSDLAAMGAVPRWALLSLSLPSGDEAWLEGFAEGFMALAAAYGVQLVGGDTCAGMLSVTVTALGTVEAGRALTRGGARPGDLVAVSGTLGDAGLALSRLRAGQPPDPDGARALHRPLPQVALGRALADFATACIDLSDGLLADLGHVVAASGCGAAVELAALPAGSALLACPDADRWGFQLTSGDDYQLCFTLPPARRSALAGLASRAGVPLSVVGRIEAGKGVRCITPDGQVYDPGQGGYEHFE